MSAIGWCLVLAAAAGDAAAQSHEVWVAARRLHRGSAVACSDFSLQQRAIRPTSAPALAVPCELAPGAVALRELAVGDLVRSADVGAAPAVMAGSAVRLLLQAPGIHVTARAIALADAWVGDRVEVRLDRPARTFKTRVTGPGSVQLTEAFP